MLRRWLPHSLRTRMVLLTLGIILLVQAATVATLTHYRRNYTLQAAVELTVTTLYTLRAALTRIPDPERADFVHQASASAWRLWSGQLPSNTRISRPRPDDAHDGDKFPFDFSFRRNLHSFVDRLNSHLVDGTRVALSYQERPELFVSLQPDTGAPGGGLPQEWLVIPLDRVAPPPLLTPVNLLWVGGMGLFLLLTAAFSWHVTRPLTELARAADQLAAGQPERVEPSGPSETRRLAERFNAMLDALAESDRIQCTLLAGLPHDLKGPLSRMWLRLEMSADDHLKDGMRQDLQDMHRIVGQLTDYLRGSNPATYRYTPMAIGAWLEERVAAWESTGSNVHLHGTLPEPDPPVLADPVALDRLIDNLVTNALAHGAPPVLVGAAVDDGMVVIRVIDHGRGIAPSRYADALRPFSRLDDARTRTGSVGLGLALADAIATAHGGELRLLPADTGGLEAQVRLPQESARREA